MSAPAAGHAPGARYAPGGAYGGRYAGRYAYGGGTYPYYAGHVVGPRYPGVGGRYAPGYAPPMGTGSYPYYGHQGWSYSNGYWYGAHPWGGGYWNGYFWPHVWYYPGWSWYLPVLPVGYATFWWGGVPYYYWNSLYYTYSPDYSGYVVTDPPPSEQGDAAGTAGGGYAQAGPPAAAGAADVYVYPRNGQTEAQTQTDRYECHAWAAGQTNFDPTRSGPQTGNAADYRRAMLACLDARGYSAR